MNAKRLIFGAAVAMAAMAQAADTRTGVIDGDATLQGPLFKTFRRMFRNHVLAQEPSYLVECYRNRTETSQWQSEFWGKYMHSAEPFCTMMKDAGLRAKIDESVAKLIKEQQPDGYLGNYAPSRRSAKRAWDVWGIKYTMLGLLHHYDSTGSKESLGACRRLCDYLIARNGPGAETTIGRTGNYSGMPSCSTLEPVVWLYRRTRDKKYLDFAGFIVKELTENKDGARLVDLANVPVADRSPVPRADNEHYWEDYVEQRTKAYELMSCYQGLLEYYEETGRRELLDATIATAASIMRDEINLAGGSAAHEFWFHGAEHQHEPYSRLQETCVTITWMRLCEKLLSITGDPVYADAFERTFYNAYLAALSRDGSIFAAYTPLSGYRSEGHIHCRMHTNCCNANGARGFLSFFRSILQAKGDEVFLNWFASSVAEIKVPALGEKVRIEMHTLYPRDGLVDVRMRLAKPMRFTFAVRIPACTANARVSVNGKPVENDAAVQSAPRYLQIARDWHPGDIVTLEFGLPVKAHVLHDYVAFTRGPILLARDTRFADGDIGAEIRRKSFDPENLPPFSLEAPALPDEMRMVVSADMPVGSHDENINGRLPTRIRFCDYASAGNLWRPSNAYRTFYPFAIGAREAVDRARRARASSGAGVK